MTSNKAVNQRLNFVESKVDSCLIGLDGVRAYTRLGTVELGNIPKMGNANQPEDVYQVVIDFCDKYLDLTVRRYTTFQ